MNFNKTDTAASILPSLPDGMELRLKASQSNLTAFVSRISEEDQAKDKVSLELKLEMAKTLLHNLKNYGHKANVYRNEPSLLATEINTVQGQIDFYKECLKTSHGE